MDLLELIIFAVVVLFGLLAGEKSKKKQQQQQQRVPPRPGPPPSPYRPPTAAQPPGTDDARRTAERILQELQERAERAERDGGATLEPMHTPEAVSLETLEPVGDASHRSFHDRYITALEDTPASVTPGPRIHPTVRQAREAFVLMAVFGTPKGLQ